MLGDSNSQAVGTNITGGTEHNTSHPIMLLQIKGKREGGSGKGEEERRGSGEEGGRGRREGRRKEGGEEGEEGGEGRRVVERRMVSF